ncbi:MAG: Fic family protein, partial [Bdellovibrionales bacterium]|nr:hypothetical protein [Bdellovibrionales bacterium]NQZ19013.1 Fic family protein [Bdellovibrionales bacterium]
PFLDSNGRLGRLLITFLICEEKLLKQPLLYLSLYFKTHRQRYYELLQSVRENGDWESWIQFFLKGIIETASQATQTAQKVLNLFEEDRRKINQSGKTAGSLISIYDYLCKNPITNTTKVKNECQISLPTVIRNMSTLASLGLVEEITGKDRHKVFTYSKYLKILNEGIS